MNKTKHSKNYWGRLRQFEIPHSIVRDGVLTLKGNPLALLLVLFEAGKAQQRRRQTKPKHVDVKIKQDTIRERSGFSKNQVSSAAKELERLRIILPQRDRSKLGEFGVNTYTLCNPSIGIPLVSPKHTNILIVNGVQYIKIPVCVVREHAAEWSVANMTSSALRMYIAICWLANRKNKAEFKVTVAELQKLAGLSTLKTANQAIGDLSDMGLVWHYGDVLQLREPYTGEPIDAEEEEVEDDPSNYWTATPKGRAKRWIPLTGDAADVERLLTECGAEPVAQHDGEYKIVCPFHADQNPSCSVNPDKGCFYCFGCASTGTLTTLVMKLRGIEKKQAISFLAGRAGQKIEFHQPEKNATKYKWRDLDRKLIKEVLRYPNKEFRQRRRVGKGWAWNVDGLPPMLYNLDLIESADIVCICEGEKDCHTIMDLKLYPTRSGDVVATTSGNAESWSDELADHLIHKRVVLMPDADEAGDRYRAAIEESLKSRGIEYRVVGFKDAGAKDVSDFVANGGTSEDIEKRVGRDWLRANEPSPYDPVEYEDGVIPAI